MKNYLVIIIFPLFSFAQIDEAIKLKEVIVSKSKINTVDLGIISNKTHKLIILQLRRDYKMPIRD
jgi:hypothetical protein